VAAGALALGARWGEAAVGSEADPNRLALLSDIHLDADRAFVHRTGISILGHFKQVCDGVLGMTPRPAAVLVNGDIAHLRGRPEDYAVVAEGIEVFRKAGLPVHLGVGNHDDRENLLKAVKGTGDGLRKVEGRRVLVQRLPVADWYMLDSLATTNKTPGTVGEGQLAWLAKQLDTSPNRPAVLMVHHQPDGRPAEKVSGLTDTKAFLDVVMPRRQVKAVVFGHTHRWERYQVDGVHFVNLPTTAYVFDPKQPAGWVDARVSAKGMSLKLNAITPSHPKDGEMWEMAWR
jgi:3',5'-cyclic AMP phosphodiesterase CpdA